MKHWYVVQAKANREFAASVSIAAEGFPVFLPVRTVERKHARKIERVSRPLFPRYLFVSIDLLADRWGPINRARGVSHILCGPNGKPSPVRDAVIETIRRRDPDCPQNLRTLFQPGTRVTIKVGPYADLPATYVGEDRGIASVVVELFGKSHHVPVPVIDIIPDGVIDRNAA